MKEEVEVEVGVEVLHREKEDGGEVEERSLPGTLSWKQEGCCHPTPHHQKMGPSWVDSSYG